MSPFEIWIRTGRIVPTPKDVERKFNHWHDPEDGQFTFSGQGNYVGGGGSFGVGGAGGSSKSPRFGRFDPRNPDNYSIYTVKRGESLTSIAARRHGLTAADLAWLNGMRANDKLRMAQEIKLPHQSYLDAGRAAKNNFLALAQYMNTHGNLPPNVAHAPLPSTTLPQRPVKREVANGYEYDFDDLNRMHKVTAHLVNAPTQGRSRSAQITAGGPDRLDTDHGGHFIARRFNGPTNEFNHFAQDASFNRGEFAALEQKWAKALQAGKDVWVEIKASYEGDSKRPSLIIVTYKIDNRVVQSKFRNVPGGR